MKKTLSEGAIAGHMMHLYENTDLSFADIAKVFRDTANGKLEFTEKTDGQNNYLSFNLQAQEARAARNKSHQAMGGVNIDGLRKFFTTDRTEAGKNAAPDSVVEAFAQSMASFESVVKSFPTEVQEELFLDENDNPIFYNTEVMAVENPNVINYDKDTLLVHQVGHKKRNPETKRFEDLEGDEISKYLENLKSALKKFNESVREQKFSVEINNIKTLDALKDKKILEKAITELQKEVNSAGLGMSDTIGDYVVAKADSYLAEKAGFYFPDQVQMEILKIILQIADPGDKKKEFLVRDISRLKEIVKTDESEKTEFQLTQLDQLRDKRFVADMLKGIIRPIELIIHEFAVEALRGFKSAWIIDNSEKADELANQLNDAVRTLEQASSEYEAIIPVLQSQLEKLKKIDDQFDISTPVEGIVFSYGGNTYKFTGNFAPFNQLNGLFTFGRKGVPALKGKYDSEDDRQMKLTEEDEFEKDVTYVFIPGGFKPPHKGHLSLIEQAYEQNEEANIKIVSGKEQRGGKGDESLVEWHQAEKIWAILLENAGFRMGSGSGQVQIDYFDPIDTGRIKKSGEPIMTKSPIVRIGQFAQGLETGTQITIVSSKADARYGEVFEKVISHHANEVGKQITVNTVALNTADIKEGEKISATAIRQATFKDDLESFRRFYPDNLPEDKLISIFNIIKGEKPKEETLNEELINMIESTLEEMSSMAGGAVQGHSGGGKPFKEDEEMTNEEQKLRQIVRRIIKVKKKKVEEQKLYEDKLRNLIRKIIISEAKEEQAPHRLTSINMLNKFMLENGKTIENFYKELTSNFEQRESFRKHFFNAIVNKLQINDIFDDIEEFVTEKVPQVDLKGGLSEQKEINVRIGADGVLEKEPDQEELEKEKELERIQPDDFKGEEQIPGLDPMGRQGAYKAFNRVVDNLLRFREMPYGDREYPLDPNNPDSPEMTEKEIFTYYLFLNLQLFFELWEEKYFGSPGEEVEEIEDTAKKQKQEQPISGFGDESPEDKRPEERF